VSEAGDQGDGTGAPGSPVPDVVVVGAASRDIISEDPRGWRLGGGVSYSALTTARLGLRTGALLGADPEACGAPEIDLLRATGVDVRLVPLERGPVFENVETPGGRVQRCFGESDPIPVSKVPPAWLNAPGWILAPVAGELPEAWAGVLPRGATVALGWQGLLRTLGRGHTVERRPPSPSALLRRADLVGVSRTDLSPEARLEDLVALLRPGAALVLTQAERGGLVVETSGGRSPRLRRYPAIRAGEPVDSTGAGDAFLASLLAARVRPGLVGGRSDRGWDLLLAAAVGSLTVEGAGLLGIPSRSAVRRRMSAGLVRG